MKRVLLIGGDGQLGTEIRHTWSDVKISAPSHAELDIRNASEVDAAIAALGADIVMNCAAFHDVDRCEQEPDRAFEVNTLAVDGLARICRARNLIFVTISTDYVFDGESKRPYREDDPARPISTYGVSKLAGEFLVSHLDARAFIVRTCGLYGNAARRSKASFIDRIIQRARDGEALRVVNDVIATPTYAGHLAQALRRLVESPNYGVYHVVNQGAVSWYDFAKLAVRCAGLEATVEAISSVGYVTEARRPRYSALDGGKIASLGIHMPGWRSGIEAYFS